MTYRKFQANHLFTGREMADEDAVLITTEEGVVQTILSAAEAGEGVERLKGWLSPGFLNCHCHLELSHLKGKIPEKTGLVDFLLAVIKERAASDDPQTITAAIMQAEEAMLHNGIVAVGDVCNTAYSLPQKKEGRLFYHNFIEAIGFADESADQRFAGSFAVFSEFAQAYALPIEANSMVPHAPYSVGSRLFGLIANFPGNHLLTIHNQEDETENEFYRNGKGDLTRLYERLGIASFFKGTGKRSLESFLPHFYRNQTLILVHNVATREEDLRFALAWQEKGGSSLFFCLCPNANRYIGVSGSPDPELLIRHDCRIVVGTDSLASNHQLSILEELKTLQRQFPALPAATLLQWATHNGAQALQLDAVLGDFTPGKQPGVLLIENMEEGRFSAGSKVKRLL